LALPTDLAGTSTIHASVGSLAPRPSWLGL
jgi:hypothetical protein